MLRGFLCWDVQCAGGCSVLCALCTVYKGSTVKIVGMLKVQSVAAVQSQQLVKYHDYFILQWACTVKYTAIGIFQLNVFKLDSLLPTRLESKLYRNIIFFMLLE